ncbi:hypothetical protein, partial [Pseudomonas bubulae]|uniref:hypothetical protein n=1 Tax=Pseudomonas bubulae TaxID=2316085 RepID=UPI002B1D4FA4
MFPIRSWGGDPEIRVRVRVKAGMEFLPSAQQGPQWTRDSEGAYRATFRASQLGTLEFRIMRPAPTIYFGGPTFGIGGRLDQR